MFVIENMHKRHLIRDSLRKFPLVKHLLIAEAYNEVNENNTLIMDSCCSGEYNSHII